MLHNQTPKNTATSGTPTTPLKKMLNGVKRLPTSARRHKWRTGIVVLIIAAALYYLFGVTSTVAETKYVLSPVMRGYVAATVTGTGQVAASNQVDIKSKASGDVTWVGVENGASVKAGQALLQLDTREAAKAVRDARASLESAEISYEKTVKPADSIDILQAENALNQATADLSKSYDDGFTSVSNAFIDLPDVTTGLKDVLYTSTINKNSTQDNISAYTDMVKDYDAKVLIFRDDVATKYTKALAAYNATFLKYRSMDRSASRESIEALVKESYTTSKAVAEAVKSASDLLSFVKDRLTDRNQSIPAALTTHQSVLSGYATKTNSHLVSLLNISTTMTNAIFSVKEKTESLADLKAGADALDVRASKLSVEQRENALRDAEEKLADYTPRAPFDGKIAKMTIRKGDSLSSGTTVATIITPDRIAELSLNEVDAAKVKVGQAATLTFDALDEVELRGKVSDVDTVGTVSQGVVTYMVKISFATPDAQTDLIKPGMSVSATIITEEKTDALSVSASAIKTLGDRSYVEMIDDGVPVVVATTSSSSSSPSPRISGFMGSTTPGDRAAFMSRATSTEDRPLRATMNRRAIETVTSVAGPRRVFVEIGIAGDTMVEIVAGLSEGDKVVSQTITGTTGANAASTRTSTPTIFGAGSGARGATSGTLRGATGR